MAEWASDLELRLKSPAFPTGADLRGEGSDQAVFLKLAKPIGHGVSLGVLLGWERSALTSIDPISGGYLNYTTPGLPAFGGGAAA
jgi:hypothetical protein